MMNLIKNCKIAEVGAPVAAATGTDQNTDILDMSGFDGVVFMVPITDSVTTGVATLTVEQADSNADTGMTALTGASATATCVVDDDLNNKLLVVDVYKPTKRYVSAPVTSATANIAFGNTIAIQYKSKKGPITEHASILNSACVAGPAEA